MTRGCDFWKQQKHWVVVYSGSSNSCRYMSKVMANSKPALCQNLVEFFACGTEPIEVRNLFNHIER